MQKISTHIQAVVTNRRTYVLYENMQLNASGYLEEKYMVFIKKCSITTRISNPTGSQYLTKVSMWYPHELDITSTT